MAFPIIDLHCDVLFQLDGKNGDFLNPQQLDTNLFHLRAGGVKVQAFAIFVFPQLNKADRIKSALRQYQCFKEQVLRPENHVVHITKWSQMEQLQPHEMGAFLTIEGIDFIDSDLMLWHLFKDLGVLNIGLTWNYANEAADGVEDDRGRGLTSFGREIVQLNNAHQILTDVTHLSERSFWDVIECAKYPIATHSNTKAVCNHYRNLSDEQILAMIEKNAPMHVVYYPPFIKERGPVYIADLIQHIDHICALGGKHLIGLGSDFDGIDAKIVGLENASQHPNLLTELLKVYSDDEVKGFAYQNFLNNCPKETAESSTFL